MAGRSGVDDLEYHSPESRIQYNTFPKTRSHREGNRLAVHECRVAINMAIFGYAWARRSWPFVMVIGQRRERLVQSEWFPRHKRESADLSGHCCPGPVGAIEERAVSCIICAVTFSSLKRKERQGELWRSLIDRWSEKYIKESVDAMLSFTISSTPKLSRCPISFIRDDAQRLHPCCHFPWSVVSFPYRHFSITLSIGER